MELQLVGCLEMWMAVKRDGLLADVMAALSVEQMDYKMV
jgi:hypothetical protein